MHHLLCSCLALSVLLPPIAAAATAVPADQLIAAAQLRLQERAEGIPGEWQFLPAGAVGPSTVEQGGELRIEAGAIDGRWPRSRVGVPVRILAGDALLQARMLWFTVHVWRQAQVYARDMQAGERSDDLETQVRRIDIAGYGAEAAMPGGVGLQPGLRLLRSVRAGQPVLASDFAQMPLVARNTQVALQVRRGGVILNTAATARTDATIGERVSVLPSGATQWIEATVKGRNEVAIED